MGFLKWAIVVVPGGTQPGTVASSNNSSLYDPEQNVLAFGSTVTFTAATNSMPIRDVGSTKAMRKLKAGDSLRLLVIGSATETHTIVGTVQFFYKA